MSSFIRTILAGATATAGIVCLASPASAVEVLVGGYTLSEGGPEESLGGGGVHTTSTQQGNTINAFVNGDGSAVTFFSNNILTVTGSGQATVAPLSGLIEALTVSFAKGWENITFNFGGNPGTFDLLVNGNVAFAAGSNCAICSIGNGQNRFTLSGSGINNLAFTFDPGVSTAKQFRVEGVSAVPEPATWAMMLVGFAGIGFSMRRKAKGNLRVRFA